MKIIFVRHKVASVKAIDLRSWVQLSALVFLLSLPVVFGVLLGTKITDGRWQVLFDNRVAEMHNDFTTQRKNLEVERQRAEDSLSAMVSKLADMRSQLIGLDALSEQLTQIAHLTEGEFDFSVAPGLGGPDTSPVTKTAEHTDIRAELTTLLAQWQHSLSKRESQLHILQSMLADKQLRSELTIEGRPVKKGWLSSAYGMRTDPFHGKKRWHSGVDFADREGADIIAVASGVVTWSGKRSGYGLMVEINHGNGLTTRYAHNRENIAKLGATVKKGQVIAKMGSSGRSTGPHLHFEVLENGRAVNPLTYIRRTNH